jgi:bacterioferritin-associated ferredoxin
VIVCHCKVVTDRVVTASIDEGSRTLRQVCGSTGAGQSCGGCIFTLRRMLCEHESVSVRLVPEVESAAS